RHQHQAGVFSHWATESRKASDKEGNSTPRLLINSRIADSQQEEGEHWDVLHHYLAAQEESRRATKKCLGDQGLDFEIPGHHSKGMQCQKRERKHGTVKGNLALRQQQLP